MPTEMIPTIGHVVHYTNLILGDQNGRFPPEPQPAVIVRASKASDHGGVDDANWFCTLFIIYPSGTFFMQDVPYAAAPTRGHWNWPPRV